jgi:hypothetical protein
VHAVFETDRNLGCALTPSGSEILERFTQIELVEIDGLEPRDQSVHGVVEPRGLVGDEARRVADTIGGIAVPRIGVTAAIRDRERQAANACDRLTELIVQLVGDQTPLLVDALLDEPAELASLFEPRLGFARLSLGFHFVLDCGRPSRQPRHL